MEKEGSPPHHNSAGCWDRDAVGWRLWGQGGEESWEIIGGTGRQDPLSGFSSMSCFLGASRAPGGAGTVPSGPELTVRHPSFPSTEFSTTLHGQATGGMGELGLRFHVSQARLWQVWGHTLRPTVGTIDNTTGIVTSGALSPSHRKISAGQIHQVAHRKTVGRTSTSYRPIM